MPNATFDWEPTDGQLLTFTVSYTAEPYRPAVINADPDDCHPAEGGITDIEVELRQAEVVLFGDETQVMTWHRHGSINFGWPGGFMARVEAAVLEQCKDELMQACADDAEAAHETALANRDEALEARREQSRLRDER